MDFSLNSLLIRHITKFVTVPILFVTLNRIKKLSKKYLIRLTLAYTLRHKFLANT